MKTKITLLLLSLLISCQIISAQNKSANIECLLTVNETDWKQNSELTAQVTVTNNSENEIEMILTPSFNLDGINLPSSDPSRTGYYSKEILQYVIKGEKDKKLKKFKLQEIKPRQEFRFSLKKNETKNVEFNLSTLVWKYNFSSIDGIYAFSEPFTEPNNIWYFQIASGKYYLYFDEYFKDGKDTEIQIVSNKVEVNLNSKK